MDGYPSGMPDDLLRATTEDEFCLALSVEATKRDDFTSPEMGWPWPWENSHTTDYAYALDEGKVWASCFGHSWFDPLEDKPEDDEKGKTTVFPNMTGCSATPGSKRSGIIVIGVSEANS